MWKNLRNLLAGGLVSKGLLALANILLIKTLTKGDFALLSNFLFIQSMVSGLLFSPFLLASVPMAHLKSIQNSSRFFSAINWFQILFISLVILLVMSLGPIFSVWIFQKAEFFPSILFGLLASMLLTLQNIALSRQQAVESFRRYNLINLARPVILILVLAGLYAMQALNFYTAAISFLISILAAASSELWGSESIFKIKGIRMQMRQFAWFWRSARILILFFFIRGTYDHIGYFFVSRFFSIEEIANYSVPFRYYAMADLIVVTSHIPFINSFTRDGFATGLARYRKWIKLTALGAAGGLLVLPWSKPLFVLISGAQYADSFSIFCVLVVGLIPYLLFSPGIYGLVAKEEFLRLLVFALIALLVHVLLCWQAAQSAKLWLIAASTVGARGFIYIFSAIRLFQRI